MSREMQISFYPQLEYFMNEELCDVVFIIDGQRLPAKKQILIFNNKVFKAMFTNGFKETTDKEVVIEDTTFEAFKTFIVFLYCNHLDFNYDTDLAFIKEICKLADKYDVPLLLNLICAHLKTVPITLDNFAPICSIASIHKCKVLLSCVQSFIEENFQSFADKTEEQLIAMNELTDNSVLKVFIKNYSKVCGQLRDVQQTLDQLRAQVVLRSRGVPHTRGSYRSRGGSMGGRFCH